ncbi:unnamed protein product [Gordionus sp. m RMFG-2023]|uniref:KH domain-containing RNA-binding protein QKI-like isoform X1 n=2 Tax=Gordionus sp. m RMFG-2023 TaxID=3053472 RepID=UPI0030DF45BA
MNDNTKHDTKSNNNSTTEYLAQLLKDKKQITTFPNLFMHLDRLLDDEIGKVRALLLNSNCNTKSEPLDLPEPTGSMVTLSDKIYVPTKDYPEFNFIGRILGPRGMTAKHLEQETGCKIMIRGKGSMRDKKKEEQNKGKPNWEHLGDELHVLITIEDTEERAIMRMNRAKDEIARLLIPAAEGEDELKKMQLMELAILNGTFRDPNCKNNSQQINHIIANSFNSLNTLNTINSINSLNNLNNGTPLSHHHAHRLTSTPMGHGGHTFIPAGSLVLTALSPSGSPGSPPLMTAHHPYLFHQHHPHLNHLNNETASHSPSCNGSSTNSSSISSSLSTSTSSSSIRPFPPIANLNPAPQQFALTPYIETATGGAAGHFLYYDPLNGHLSHLNHTQPQPYFDARTGNAVFEYPFEGAIAHFGAINKLRKIVLNREHPYKLG